MTAEHKMLFFVFCGRLLNAAYKRRQLSLMVCDTAVVEHCCQKHNPLAAFTVVSDPRAAPSVVHRTLLTNSCIDQVLGDYFALGTGKADVCVDSFPWHRALPLDQLQHKISDTSSASDDFLTNFAGSGSVSQCHVTKSLLL